MPVSWNTALPIAGATHGNPISPIPVGWYYELDNDPSWQTRLTGNIIVGAAALSADQFRQLHLRIKKHEFHDLKFAISGTLSLTSDFLSESQVPLEMADFTITPVR